MRQLISLVYKSEKERELTFPCAGGVIGVSESVGVGESRDSSWEPPEVTEPPVGGKRCSCTEANL